jgi:hypothetical protein
MILFSSPVMGCPFNFDHIHDSNYNRFRAQSELLERRPGFCRCCGTPVNQRYLRAHNRVSAAKKSGMHVEETTGPLHPGKPEAAIRDAVLTPYLHSCIQDEPQRGRTNERNLY